MRQPQPFLHVILATTLVFTSLIVGINAHSRGVSARVLTFQIDATATPISPSATPAISSTLSPTSTVLPFIQGPFEIGRSAKNRPIQAYQVGHGPIKRAVIGAIHGGFERNTITLMNQMLTYLRRNPQLVPPQISLYIVPVMNPDGNAAGTDRVRGRMNGNGVDLNRNWDYQWNITATHGNRVVSGGAGPFSEPETRAVRDFIETNKMDAVIFYHSQFDAVFSGTGHDTSKTVELALYMAQATGYRYRPEGVVGQLTTGDSIDYLTAKAGIAAIEIELLTQRSIDWDRNLPGLIAFLSWGLDKP